MIRRKRNREPRRYRWLDEKQYSKNSGVFRIANSGRHCNRAAFPMANPSLVRGAVDTPRNAAVFPTSKEEWSRRTWNEAHDIEYDLYLRNNRFDLGKCKICNKPFGNLALHLAGQNHYKKVYAYVNGQWSPPDEEPPYQCWVFPDGSHHFLNHLTMQYRVVEDVSSILQNDPIIQRVVPERSMHSTQSDPNLTPPQQGTDQEEQAVPPPPHDPNSPNSLPDDAEAEGEAEADVTEQPSKIDADSPPHLPLPSPPHHSTTGGGNTPPPPECHFEDNDVLQITETFKSVSKNEVTILYRGEHVREVRIDNDGDLLVIIHNVLYDDANRCVQKLNVAGRRTGERKVWIKSKHLDKVRLWIKSQRAAVNVTGTPSPEPKGAAVTQVAPTSATADSSLDVDPVQQRLIGIQHSRDKCDVFLKKYLSGTLTVEQLGSWKKQLENLRKFNLTKDERQLYRFGRAQQFTEDFLPIGASIPSQQNPSDFVMSKDFTCISAGELRERLREFGVDTRGFLEKKDYISALRKAHQDHAEGNLHVLGQSSASGDATSSANVPPPDVHPPGPAPKAQPTPDLYAQTYETLRGNSHRLPHEDDFRYNRGAPILSACAVAIPSRLLQSYSANNAETLDVR